MSVEMKLGIWRSRCGELHVVDRFNESEHIWKWEESTSDRSWDDQGMWYASVGTFGSDLVQYLGPLELSPTPACADQAGTPVVSPVSTETAGEQLRRVNARLSAIRSELGIFRAQVRDMERTESDLEELAKRLEREVEVVNSSSSEASACAVIQDARRGES